MHKGAFMNKLLLCLLVAPGSLLGHKQRDYTGHRQRLRETRTVQDIRPYGTREQEHQVVQLEKRKRYLKSQKNSFSAQAYSFMKYGVSFCLLGTTALFACYKTIDKDSVHSPSQFFFNSIVGYIGIVSLKKGFINMYNNLFYWKQHRQEKLLITKETISRIKDTLKGEKLEKKTKLKKFQMTTTEEAIRRALPEIIKGGETAT